MNLPSLALTLIQPWGSLIMLTGPERKDIENRIWAPGPNQLRQGDRLWIHAGKKIDGDAMYDHESVLPFDQGTCPVGVMLGHVRFDGVITESKSKWFNPAQPGDKPTIGWLFSDPVMLSKHVECIGAQRLWKVNDRMLAKLAEAA